MNIYDIDNETCPECDVKELVYAKVCNGVHCQSCGAWFNLAGELLEEEQ
jgi:hypothetical protein